MATITGTAAGEFLQGTAAADSILGLGGNDTLSGNGGSDTLDGGTGADTMIGSGAAGSNVVFYVDNAGDQVFVTTGSGTDTVNTTISYALASGVEVETLAALGSASINLTGNEFGAQYLMGNGGNNILDGGVDTLVDSLVGGNGNDTYLVRSDVGGAGGDVVTEGVSAGFDTVYATGSYELNNLSEIEVLSAADQTSTDGVYLYGNTFAQTIAANAGDNFLYDGDGTVGDQLIGLGGDDTYFVQAVNGSNTALSTVVEAAGGGDDLVYTTGNFTLGSNSEVETIVNNTGGTGLSITGNSFDQLIVGGSGDDTLGGGGGVDVLNGGDGNDIYGVDSLDDAVVDSGGTDRVDSVSSYYIGQDAAIETITFSGTNLDARVGQGDSTFNLNSLNTTGTSVVANPTYLVGNDTDQAIYGDAGANILNGYSGVDGDGSTLNADTLVGGQGDDQYRVYSQDDVVAEDTSGGGDIIYTSSDYSLADNDTNVATAAIAGTTGSDFISGPSQIEVLSAATQGANEGGIGLNLSGNDYGNIIIGDYGDNIITGGGVAAGGVDVLVGLRGDDAYVVSSSNNTLITENAGEGNDVVILSASGFALNTGASVEGLISVGTDLNITGNELAQQIQGDTGVNVLIGGGGADTLVGLDGNDTYVVDSQGVVVTEAAGEGTDTVYATVSYDLRNNANTEVELLSTQTQSGTDAINLTGNRYAQTIIGNNGDNILDGDRSNLSGNVGDTLTGLAGNDTYRVYSQADVVRDYTGQGTADVVFSSGDYQLRTGNAIESLSAADQSATTTLSLYGNETGQTVIGNAGDNNIGGGAGNDTLIGSGGNDVFHFDTTLSATTNVDNITDFTAGDRIGLGSNIFGALGGTIDSNEFVSGTTATGTNAQVLYDQTNGNIFYDADGTGTGAAVLFAHVTAGTVLAFNDFTIVAPVPATPGA